MRGYSSRREVINLLIGSVLVWLVGLSWLIYLSPVGLIANSVLFLMAFILHEYAHKISAIRHGLYAEFRIQPVWAALTAITIFLPFKIIAPGATVIYGYADDDVMGRTALWGPLVNLIMATILVPVSLFIAPYLWVAVYFNSFIALFNLIPVFVLDGRKVFAWNKRAWAAAFAASLIYFIITLFIV